MDDDDSKWKRLKPLIILQHNTNSHIEQAEWKVDLLQQPVDTSTCDLHQEQFSSLQIQELHAWSSFMDFI